MVARYGLSLLACSLALSPAFARADSPTAPAATKPAVQPPRSAYDRAFDSDHNRVTTKWLEDPLRHIEGDMTTVTGDLSDLKTDKAVQKRQDVVVSRLDTLIVLLEKQCKGSGSGGAGGTKPLERSILAKGPGGQGDMRDPAAGEKQWASLPPKQREQILQSKTAGFPAGFETILQSYYERLAQEQVEAATPEPPVPTANEGAKK